MVQQWKDLLKNMVLELKKELKETSLWGQNAPSTVDCLRPKCEKQEQICFMHRSLIGAVIVHQCKLGANREENAGSGQDRTTLDRCGQSKPDTWEEEAARTWEYNANHCIVYYFIWYFKVNICPIFFCCKQTTFIMEGNWMNWTNFQLTKNAV